MLVPYVGQCPYHIFTDLNELNNHFGVLNGV